MSKILILTDGKAGHENQSRALARALGCEADVREVHFRSRLCKSLSYLVDRTAGLCLRSLLVGLPDVRPGEYSAVVGTGSGTFYAVRVMAERLKVRSGVILYPRGYALGHFCCILAPSFDRPARLPNVVAIPANLVANDAAFYDNGVKAFAARHRQVKPAVGVIVGGPNKCASMTSEWMKDQLDRVFAENDGSEMWVTTSRRTPPDVERVVDAYPWDYRLLYSRDRFNPVPAFVKLARRLYVTAESTGMLSEACTFGTAEVRVLDNLFAGPHKFRRFVDDLRAEGYVDGNRKVDLSDPIARARELILG